METELQTAPAAVATSRPLPQARFPLLAGLTTAALLWLSYFPVDWGWFAWIALVPFLYLVRCTARPRWVYLCAWLAGLGFYFPALQWMRVADPRMYFTWIFVAVYCSLYFPIALQIIRLFDRRTRLPLVLTLPVVWTALEYIRAWFLTGFSWYLLGHSQHDYLPIIQFADLTGAYGVTFLVAAVNAVLFEALYRWEWLRVRFAGIEAPPPRLFKTMLIQAGVVSALFMAAVGYGEWRLSQDDFPVGPRIALIQGSVPQQIRNDLNMGDMMARHFIALSDLAARQKPNLIVWPETSNPDGWCETASDAPANIPAGWDGRIKEGRSEMREAAGQWATNILFGLNASVFEADGHTHQYNSALFIGRDGAAQGRYDKIHCVPFGEYVPLRDAFPWMQRFAPYDDYDYSVSPGRAETRFALDQGTARSYSFGVVICYEDTDAVRALPYVGGDGKAPVDFLLNISNDGWFDGTSEHDEHLAICRFRAVECRRAVARAVNMGISALIDGNGRVVIPQPVERTEWNDDKVRKLLRSRFAALPVEEIKQAMSLFPDDGKAAVWLASPSRGAGSLPTGRWADFKKVPAIILADVPIDNRFSLYARWGDWLPWSCWGLIGVGLVLSLVRRRRVDVATSEP